jgi:pyruvate dehydrogenase (quinone)
LSGLRFRSGSRGRWVPPGKDDPFGQGPKALSAISDEATAHGPRLKFKPTRPLLRPSDSDPADLAKTLDSAEKVTILAGAGCAGAHGELIEVADRLKAPIVHAMRGKEYIEYDNPFDVGMTGLLEFSSGYYAMMNCNTLLMLGTDFPYQQFFREDATVIQIDNRPEQIGRRTKVDIGLVGDVKATLQALTPLAQAESKSPRPMS